MSERNLMLFLNDILKSIQMRYSPKPPEVKYREYYEKSKEVESKKVEVTACLLKEYPAYRNADHCFIASKHAIQMALAMKCVGCSSKISALLPLAGEYLGEGVICPQKAKEVY